jgi:hypothetical protein
MSFRIRSIAGRRTSESRRIFGENSRRLYIVAKAVTSVFVGAPSVSAKHRDYGASTTVASEAPSAIKNVGDKDKTLKLKNNGGEQWGRVPETSTNRVLRSSAGPIP